MKISTSAVTRQQRSPSRLARGWPLAGRVSGRGATPRWTPGAAAAGLPARRPRTRHPRPIPAAVAAPTAAQDRLGPVPGLPRPAAVRPSWDFDASPRDMAVCFFSSSILHVEKIAIIGLQTSGFVKIGLLISVLLK